MAPALLIFILTYAVIATERVHRTTAALVGGLAMVVAGVIGQTEAFAAIDFNVIFLLVGMMIIADVMRRTGFFQWVAILSAKLARGEPFAILLVLSTITAIGSAFLDNVTIVVLVAPLTLYIAGVLNTSPIPFLIAEILASNIGGTATLIGDPPNILIASAAGLSFVDFIVHLTPISLIVLVAFLLMSRFLFRHQLSADAAGRAAILAMNEREMITDPRLLRRVLVVLGLVLAGFVFHSVLHLQTATIALGGAALLLLWTKEDPHHVLREVEWTTLFFFVGLFMTVEGLVATGVIEQVARLVLAATQGDLTLTSLALLWMSALLSGLVDNIPYTAAMIPLVHELGEVMPPRPLWWSLALGADLGGNATLVGASANVVIASIAERAGYPIGFGTFLKYGLLVTVVSMLLSTLYIWLRYL